MLTLYNLNTSSSYKLRSFKLLKRYVSLVLWMYRQANKNPYWDLLNVIKLWTDENGLKWTVDRLKLTHISLLQYLAQQVNLHEKSTDQQRLAKTNDGIPKWLPHSLRDLLRKRDADAIRAILAIVTVYRVIPVKGSLKLKTIVSPFSGLTTKLQESRLDYVVNLLPRVSKPLGLSTLLPLRTAAPNGKPSIMSAPLDAFALASAKPHKLLQSLQTISDYFRSDIFRLLQEEMDIVSNWKVTKPDLKLGKLAFKEEPAGKVRVFAMVDVWSQSILEPIHKHMFDILSGIKQDGCFDQGRPLDLLMAKGYKDLYSFDLSAATDRLPIDIQVQVLSRIYNPRVAEAWKDVLIDRPYILSLHDLKKYSSDVIFHENDKFGDKGFKLWYSVGQPMGALSSWAVFAVSHHVIVQYCARQAGFTTWFEDYALLGDDIVIANKKVADIYLYTMVEILGVEINMSKSIISTNGFAEFAKRFVSQSVDYTPIGAKNISQSLKSFANFPSLLRDYISKGGYADNGSVRTLIETLTYDISKVSNKNLTSLLYVLIGPFGFVNTGNISFKSVYEQAGVELSPYDMRLRQLGYALDHLIPFVKDVLREGWNNDQEKAIEKSIVIIKETVSHTQVKGFLNINVSKDLKALVPYGTIPSIWMLSSWRNYISSMFDKQLDRLSEETPYISYPYSLPFVEGVRYMITALNRVAPIKEVSLFAKPRVERPRFKQVNKQFFMKVRELMLSSLKGKRILNE